MNLRRFLTCLSVVLAGILLTWLVYPAHAYIEAPYTLGKIISDSTNVVVLRVDAVDKEKNLIVYKKVRDLKGTHNGDTIKHNIGHGGFNEREWKFAMAGAEVGKLAVFFHNGSAAECYLGGYWYQVYPGGEWWTISHGEPFLLRSYAGNVDKLIAAVTDIVAGKEVVVACMVDGNKDDLHLRRARIQRCKASMKLQDYDQKRDFVGWGGEDFRRLGGMAGFTHYCAITRVDPEAQSIAALDVDGDGKPDLCLAGGGRLQLLQNAGDALNELSLPGLTTGCRAAVWADYNGDGKPDLLLATPTGPKLYTNLGGGNFRDDTHLLPREPGYNLTCAAWIDQDGDGRPDILLGNGYHGLRLYRNKGPLDPGPAPVRLGNWSYIGPFPNQGGRGFDTVYPPEKEFDLKKKYGGKNGEEAIWRDGKFIDGDVNNLALFKPENTVDAVVYVHREIDCTAPTEMPISLGSDDTLTVWLNGEKIHAENIQRACEPDQVNLKLKLKQGKNHLLMKICQGGGEWAFYFKSKGAVPLQRTWAFEDVSDEVGLGAKGIGSKVKGDTLTVCAVKGDGRQDFLYGAGTGLLVLNTPKGFVEAKDSGISYKPGRIGPVFGDFEKTGHPALFVPQENGCKLFRNDGTGHFTDVTEKAGLGSFKGHATCAAWGDVDNDGHLDLVVGCLHESNRFFRNKGDGTFEDATEAIGLHQRIFNTQAIALVDLNGDGVLDMVFNNEGQESCVLLGNPEWVLKNTPVTLQIHGKTGIVGSRVKVTDKDGKLQGTHFVSGGDGRGSQAPPTARFALKPGKYRVELVFSNGVRRAKDIEVASTHLKAVLDDTMPPSE